MKPRIAIQPDRFSVNNGIKRRFCDRWFQLCEERHWEYEVVDVYSKNSVAQIPEYDAFLWRVGPNKSDRDRMETLAAIFESYTNLVFYPSLKTMLTRSKLQQSLIFDLLDVPHPETHVFYDLESALSFSECARYPLITKLDSGNQSQNVAMLNNAGVAKTFITRLFETGVASMDSEKGALKQPSLIDIYITERIKPSLKVALGYSSPIHATGKRIETGYFYAQEFIADNDYDTRVTVIGDRAFGLIRLNRADDFRASGSGQIDWAPEKVDPKFIHLALDTARKLGTQTNAMDFIYRAGDPVLLECNLSFAGWPVERCPGHWIRGEDRTLSWIEGHLMPEDAIFDDLCQQLKLQGFE